MPVAETSSPTDGAVPLLAPPPAAASPSGHLPPARAVSGKLTSSAPGASEEAPQGADGSSGEGAAESPDGAEKQGGGGRGRDGGLEQSDGGDASAPDDFGDFVG